MRIKFVQKIIDKIRGKRERCIFVGKFKTFKEAKAKCKGYSAQNILDKTLESVLKVKNGEAVFERDSAIFDTIQYSHQMLSALFKAGIENNNQLNVLDFGGSLGSHYFQNKEFLKPIKINNWTVVEQPHYVKVGNAQIADDILNFKNSIDEVDNANILIIASVLQYLPNPYEFAEKFANSGIKYILIDRTPFALKGETISIQVVPKCLYKAQYPAWFLDENKIKEIFNKNYELVYEYELPEYNNFSKIPQHHMCYLFKKREDIE